jgi:hypothetical protein
MADLTSHDLNLGETPQGAPASEADHRHEQRDANIRLVALFAGIMIALAIGMHLLLGGMMALFRRTPAPDAAGLPPIRSAPVPAPRLWNFPEPDRRTPEQNYAARRREEERLLTTYGWVDPAKGVVRLPIERAKELLLAEPASRIGGQPMKPAAAPENEIRLSSPPIRP